MHQFRAGALGVVLAALGAAAPSMAQENPFANGKPLTMIIGFGPGGGYDLWGRTVARYIGKHLPGNPNGVPQNMPGAGSYNAANHIYNVAPKDGTVMGIIARDAPIGPLTGQKGPRFDPLKISWIGTPTKETNVCIAYNAAKVKKVDDLYTTELIVGDTGVGTGTHAYPKALSAILGMKFRLIAGFPSSSDVFLAMERGEVDGICESLDSVHGKKPDWIPKKTVNIVFQGGAAPNPEIKDVPFIVDLAKTDEQRAAIRFLYAGQAIGRPFVAPPDLPPARLKMLRDAFNATMKDPDFISETKRLNLDLDPETGEQLEATIRQIYATPPAIVKKVGELIK
jgi:tripartite-type tricarboxylate transporter receptor subunit TctC